jgi:biotin carboxyl carrier protein
MKMRNIIRASREGTIASVEVSVGDKVAFGTVLVRYA